MAFKSSLFDPYSEYDLINNEIKVNHSELHIADKNAVNYTLIPLHNNILSFILVIATYMYTKS